MVWAMPAPHFKAVDKAPSAALPPQSLLATYYPVRLSRALMGALHLGTFSTALKIQLVTSYRQVIKIRLSALE